MESLEDLPQLVGRNAHAAIAYRGHDVIAAIVHIDADVAALGRVLDRVLQQVAEDLLKAVAIAVDDALVAFDIDAEVTIAECGVMAMHDVAHEVRPRNRLA